MRLRALAALVTFLAAGCYPELDWRELKSAEGGFSALMPAKPRYEARTLSGPAAVTMHLWSARAAGSVFGVGYADYPAVDAGVLDGVRDALARNVGGRVVEEKPIVQSGLAGRDFVAEAGTVRVRALLLVSGARLYQIAVVGDRDTVASADLDLFLSSFQPVSRGPSE